MDDLISRQEAIDAVKEERFPIDSDYAEGFMAALDKVEWILKEWLPSAQPETHEELTETHACDLIDRQAAIDALDKHLRTTDVPVSYPGIISALTEWLNEVPPSQSDLSGYSDKLWKKAYERGKAEALAQLEEAYISGETEAEARFHAQQRWIPCSERLPENGHYYLWCSDMGNVQSDYYWDGFENGMKYGYNIVAWMPLPEPYQAERRTDEKENI